MKRLKDASKRNIGQKSCLPVQFLRLYIMAVFLLGAAPCIAETTTPEEDEAVERLRKTGQQMVLEELKSIRSEIISAGNQVDQNGQFWISPQLPRFGTIDALVSERIDARKKAIRRIILETAREIELKRNPTLTFEGTQVEVASNQQQIAQKLDSAIRKNNVSINSLSLAIKMVVGISAELHQAAISETNGKRKYDLYVEYTALVYELSSLLVEVLENFNQEGADEVQTLYKNRNRSIDMLKEDLNERIQDYEQDLKENKITKEEFEQKKSHFSGYLEALDTSLDAWKKILAVMENQKQWADQITSKVEAFEDLQKDSELQLRVLKELGIVKEIREVIKGLEELANIAEVPLLKLDKEIALQLLGLKSPSMQTDGESENRILTR